MISASELRNGLSVVIDGVLYRVVESQHIKPGKGGAFVRTKLKNMRTKAVIERTYRVEEKIEDAFIEGKKMQFMYKSAQGYHFMDLENYEELSLAEDILSAIKGYLKEGMEVTSLWHNHNIIEIEPPTFVELKIVHTEPGIKGDTARQALKPAQLETGAVISVPLFINQGDTIRIDTRTGEYVERA
jgi:elongation factor P